MRIEKYSQFNNELNESFWQDVKYGLSKFGRYKADGKIFGKKKVDDKSREEIKEIMKKESNKLLKQVHGEVLITAPEFPNDRRKVTFLRGIIIYAQFYDSLVAATKKKPEEEGYMAPDVANAIIQDMRTLIKKHLDVDLKAVYTTFESIKNDDLTEEEIYELYNFSYEADELINEEIKGLLKSIGKGISKGYQGVVSAKDRAMDSLFGAKKGTDAAPKTSRGQSAKLQSTSGQKNVDSERMKGLGSNKLPMTLLGVGASLGAFSWLVNTQWFKELFTTVEHTESTEIIQKTVETKAQIFSTVDPGEGMTQMLNKTMDLNLAPQSSPEDFVSAVKTLGDGNVQSGIDAMTAQGGMFPNNAAAKAGLEEICNNPHKYGDNLGEIFQGKMAGTGKTFGDIFVTHPGGTLTAMITKTIVTAVPKIVAKTTVKVGAAYYAMKALGPLAGKLGIGLVAAGAVVKLLREKGQRQSRAKTLNDLLQSLLLVKKEDTIKQTDDKGNQDDKDNKTAKGIYPLMIKNLKALQSMLISFDGVELEGGGNKIQVGKVYTFTNKKGEKKKVKVVSLTNDMGIGDDKKWLTEDDEKRKKLMDGAVSVIYQDENGKFTSKSPQTAVFVNQLSESHMILPFSVFEKQFTKQPRKVVIGKDEDYLTQAYNNIAKQIKSIKDEKDKGIGVTDKFIEDILTEKMKAKDTIKLLYADVYDHLYGKYASTMPNFDKLYKESVDVISDKNKRKVVAEKIARLSKRSMQFEGENMYAGLGEFGADMEEFNTTLNQIMDYFKSEKVTESLRIRRFNSL
jgi:hypothetical protein